MYVHMFHMCAQSILCKYIFAEFYRVLQQQNMLNVQMELWTTSLYSYVYTDG